MYDVDALRRTEFPHSQNQIYFHHAGISPLPQRTKRKMQWAIEALSKNPATFWMETGMAASENLQATLAALINAESPEEIVPVTTTSFALNSVAQAIAWQRGDNIAFCELEFPSNAYPWMSLERDGVEIRQVPAVDGGLTLAALREVVDNNTRLVAASAIQFFSGHRTDLAAIGAFCYERDIIFVVDAIQAIGHMPIDVQAMHIDVLASGGQKSILAMPGVGFLYVRDGLAATLQPRFIGSNATENFIHWLNYDLTPGPSAQRFAAGTPNLVGIIGLLESVGLLNELGIANIDRHTRKLTARAIAQLTVSGYHVITPEDAPGPIVTFRTGMSEEATDALVNQLEEHQVTVVKHLDSTGTPHLRLSFHCYNTADEVDRFMKILGNY